MTAISLEASVSHAALARRTVVTVVLTGGDLVDREAAAHRIIAQLQPPTPSPPPEPVPTGLSAVFALLASPPPRQMPPSPPPPAVPPRAPPVASPTRQAVQPKQKPPAADPPSAYDEPFILAPIG